MNLSDSLKHLSHHAYYIIGRNQERDRLIKLLEETHHIGIKGNPDFFDRRYEVLTIDEAREIKSLAETRPVTASGRKIFILTMDGITLEAQNALLKLLEEPPEYAHFFLIIHSAHLLLPTVKSRLSFLGEHVGRGMSDAKLLESTKAFVKSSKKGRLETIKSLMEEIAKEKRPKQDALDFLNALSETIHTQGLKDNIAPLEAVEIARKYGTDRAPSLKMLLEYVALNI